MVERLAFPGSPAAVPDFRGNPAELDFLASPAAKCDLVHLDSTTCVPRSQVSRWHLRASVGAKCHLKTASDCARMLNDGST